MKFLCILGRQPALGLAELESRFGAQAVQPLGRDMAILQTDEAPAVFNQLGSVVKVGKIVDQSSANDWMKLSRYLVNTLPGDWRDANGSKLTIGISVYGLPVKVQHINATALSLKKALRSQDEVGSVRVVPNKQTDLNAAQVLHNKLATSTGLELLLVRDNTKVLIAQTKWVQDIETYSQRDQERPMRDSKVGMLPPKLAQIIINLAIASTKPDHGSVILDPFCGTGVLLQEASLMGFDIAGSDLEPRMVEYTDKNLLWLADQSFSTTTSHSSDGRYYKLDQGDATSMVWQPMPNSIACETYLGRPFAHEPDPQILRTVMNDTNQIHKKFLQNVARQTQAGFRMCIAVPAWHTKSGIKHLAVLDHLEELGYNRVSFVHAHTRDLVYHRENQVVGRELVVLVRS